MITIPLQLSDELAKEVLPLQNRLPEIIELGLRQLRIATDRKPANGRLAVKESVMAALESTGIVTLPKLNIQHSSRKRRTPINVSGPPASEMIIAERRQGYEPATSIAP